MAREVFDGCRYCGTSDRTREHALARQLAGLIPQPESMTAERLRIGRGTTEHLSDWTTSTPASVVVRDFCGRCNSGWMNDLDSAIKPEFAEFCVGRARSLDTDGLARWSSWVVKQYFNYAAAYPDDYSRPSDYRAFYETRRPLPGMQVYIGLCSDPFWQHIHGQRPMFLSPIFDADSAEQRVGLQLWTAGYGQLAIQVLHVHDPRLNVGYRPDSQPVARLWPDPTPELDLAQLPRLDPQGFAALTKHRPLFDGW